MVNNFLPKLRLLVLATLAATSSIGHASNLPINDRPFSSPYELMDFQNKMSASSEKERADLIGQNLKLKAMYDFSKNIAIRAAISSQLQGAKQSIDTYSRQLDAIYNFAPLMIQGRVVPPVITEAHNLYNQTDKLQIRLSSAIYTIDKQAYFSSTAPNWRDYLKFPEETNAFEKFGYVTGEMKPKTPEEKEVWEKGTLDGWNLGVAQANVILNQSFDRLNRDYIGMIRFHKFTIEGKINMPIISNYNLYDTNSGDKLILDEKLLKINVLPTFTKNTLSNNKEIQAVAGSNVSPALRELLVSNLKDKNLVKPPASTTIENSQLIVDKMEAVQNNKHQQKPWSDYPNNPVVEMPVVTPVIPVDPAPVKTVAKIEIPD